MQGLTEAALAESQRPICGTAPIRADADGSRRHERAEESPNGKLLQGGGVLIGLETARPDTEQPQTQHGQRAQYAEHGGSKPAEAERHDEYCRGDEHKRKCQIPDRQAAAEHADQRQEDITQEKASRQESACRRDTVEHDRWSKEAGAEYIRQPPL